MKVLVACHCEEPVFMSYEDEISIYSPKLHRLKRKMRQNYLKKIKLSSIPFLLLWCKSTFSGISTLDNLYFRFGGSCYSFQFVFPSKSFRSFSCFFIVVEYITNIFTSVLITVDTPFPVVFHLIC